MSIINIKQPEPWRLHEVIWSGFDLHDGATNSQTTYDEPHSFLVPLQKVIAKMTTTSFVQEMVLLKPGTSFV